MPRPRRPAIRIYAYSYRRNCASIRRVQKKHEEMYGGVDRTMTPPVLLDRIAAKMAEDPLALFAPMRFPHQPCREDRHQAARQDVGGDHRESDSQ